MTAMDSLKRKIKEVRASATDIERMLIIPDGAVLSVDQMKQAIDGVIAALIEMAEVAEVMERTYAASFLLTGGTKNHE